MPLAATYAALEAVLARYGLTAFGGLVFREGEEAPCGASGVPAKAVVLVGHAGSSFWPYFAEWRAREGQSLPNPLDRWSKATIGSTAATFGLRAVFPSDKPWQPFQAWVKRALGLKASPLGLLIHPCYGLWQAFRGAVLFDSVPRDLPPPLAHSHPCDDCLGRPCLSACPVAAFDGLGYDVAACRKHIAAPRGEACLSGGCLARLACPVGGSYAYLPEQQAFHMAAFAQAGRQS